jgi:hypothetical protein
MCFLTTDPKQRDKQSWARVCKTVGRNRLFLYVSWLFRYFIIVMERWMTHWPSSSRPCCKWGPISLPEHGVCLFIPSTLCKMLWPFPITCRIRSKLFSIACKAFMSTWLISTGYFLYLRLTELFASNKLVSLFPPTSKMVYNVTPTCSVVTAGSHTFVCVGPPPYHLGLRSMSIVKFSLILIHPTTQFSLNKHHCSCYYHTKCCNHLLTCFAVWLSQFWVTVMVNQRLGNL